ncbi:unnamed protein product [Lactuca saligna]|uniref:Uncharacterized protein n=1 Tax=Lactuca saligna TaxID=75948 RepID=A0AA35USH2_LACSI|nr:unnamed protein product [Lactuca saligna]
MADSSSVLKTSSCTNILPIRAQQSLVIDLNPKAYENYMYPMVECLKYSPLVLALSKVEVVLMECLSKVFSTAHYDRSVDRIYFDLLSHKTSISKQRFCWLLGFEADESRVNPDTITVGQLFPMFYNMGYTEILTMVTKFKKSCLPPPWNGFFTIQFKGLSERSSGSDGASKLFMTILYGLYHDLNLDYGSVLWQQLIQSLASSSRHTEVSYAKFWTLITKWAMDKLHVPTVAGSLLSTINVFHTTKIIVTDPTKFSFVGSIPDSMSAGVSKESIIMKAYKDFRPSGPRELSAEMVQSINDADKPATRGKKPEQGKIKKGAKGAKGPFPKKRKPSKPDLSPPAKKKKVQPRRKLILSSSSKDSEENHSDSYESARGETPPHSPGHEVHVSSKPPSPSPIPTSSIPIITSSISIPSISNPISIPPITTSLQTTTTSLPPPLFTEATTTTTREVLTNVSNTGVSTSQPEPTSAPEPTITTEPPTAPLSPTPSAETETFLGGEDTVFDSIYYSPYQLQSDDDDDAPVTKKHIKELHEKIDNIVASSSSSTSHFSEAAIQGMVESLSKAHEASISSVAAATDKSTKASAVATEKVEKLFQDAQIWLESLQAASETNTKKICTVVEKLSSVADRLLSFQATLAAESTTKEELDRQSSELTLATHQLSQAEKEIDSLRSEKAVVKSCVSDVHGALSNIIEAHDLILNYSVRRSLAEKLAPALALLIRIEGILE